MREVGLFQVGQDLHGPAKRESCVGVGLSPGGWQGAHPIVVKLERRTDLSEAIGAGGATACFASRHQRGEEQRGEERRIKQAERFVTRHPN